MPINHRRGPCRFCSKPVGRRKGFAERSARTGIWLVWHGRCDPNPPTREGGPKDAKFNRKPPEQPPAAPRRPYYVDGDDD